jgi:hypothetical protein
MTTNRLAKSSAPNDPDAIENMPGYVPPKERKEWTPAEHCDFANQQLAWRRTNEYRKTQGLGPVRWVLHGKMLVLEQ